jgi:hypothetical protein
MGISRVVVVPSHATITHRELVVSVVVVRVVLVVPRIQVVAVVAEMPMY